MRKNEIQRLTLGAMFLALALLLPFLTGQIQQIGNKLLPMHLPVLLCGFVCGWPVGLAVGLVAPLLRSVLFGMPPLFPVAVAMAFELAAYGAATGILYAKLPKRPAFVYAALLASMLIGRVVWGLVSYPLYFAAGNAFSLSLFWAGAFANAVPGILLQIVLVPLVVLALRRAKLM